MPLKPTGRKLTCVELGVCQHRNVDECEELCAGRKSSRPLFPVLAKFKKHENDFTPKHVNKK